ncbi:unnamed protein product [Rhizophagus irregularis]|nr:unnamed protein product [Rhizophagus irregularis]
MYIKSLEYINNAGMLILKKMGTAAVDNPYGESNQFASKTIVCTEFNIGKGLEYITYREAGSITKLDDANNAAGMLMLKKIVKHLIEKPLQHHCDYSEQPADGSAQFDYNIRAKAKIILSKFVITKG